MRRTRAPAVVPAAILGTILAALLAAGLALAYAAHRPTPLDRRAASVAAGLRCPSCAGQSVADSEAPMARSMRTVVRQQLAAGETPAEIRTWFSARYGSSVLLDPPARGPGVLLVAGPALLLIAGGAFAVRAVRGPRPASVGSARRPPRRRTVGALALGAGVVAVGTAVTAALTWGGVRPGAPPSQQPAAAAEPQGSPSASAAPDSRVAQALARLKANDAAGAERLAQAVLKDDSGSPDALLVLGLAEREAGSTEAARTLQRFLAVAPSHPAAPEVRTYLQRLGATAR